MNFPGVVPEYHNYWDTQADKIDMAVSSTIPWECVEEQQTQSEKKLAEFHILIIEQPE